jgi:hypothetical protein
MPLKRSGHMANSSFGAPVLLMLIVAVAVFVLAPHARHSIVSHDTPGPLWSGER